jgi:hypothetical protein
VPGATSCWGSDMRLTHNSVKSLRSGQTVWRVACFVNIVGGPYTWLHEIHLKGKKRLHSFRSVFDEKRVLHQGLYIGGVEKIETPDGKTFLSATSGNFLADIPNFPAFTSRRAAERFQREFEEGRHMDELQRAEEALELDDRLYGYNRDE